VITTTLFWKWLPTLIVTQSSSVTLDQVMNHCGALRYSLLNSTNNATAESIFTTAGYPTNKLYIESYNLMDSVSPEFKHEKTQVIDLYVGFSEEYGLHNFQTTFKVWVRFNCWLRDVQQLKYFHDSWATTLSTMKYMIENSGPTVTKSFQAFSFNESCFDYIDYERVTYED
jgi:hypothetical protein